MADGSLPTQQAYKDLSNLERDFEKAELEICKYSTEKLKPLYERRKAIVSKIEKFWGIALEQMGDDIDQYITPQDAELFECISSIEVDREETDPRTFTLTFRFKENSFLEDNNISKTFTYIDKQNDNEEEDSEDITEAGRIKYKSSKVDIKWKKDQDLTATPAGSPPSFFTFFDWENSDDESKKDVFAQAHEVAILIADELYPNAVKLFTEAVEEEDEDDEDEEIDLEDEEEEEEEEEEEPPRKKSKK
ncbi:hypothetical protein LIPSTDRAFT_5934 [Lipomyces starkeyi NRRL Y-11557]|uniref:Nucleosome assembly protein n=1 Tax=Lipomyces starkeyi NRRL Y-11557 TaxID=675824 RepID=A0A1E3PYF8_LIPST|nr:hypothetical protein LIPSTDRAFT_5934 [Lipomyces starkeyi NRRL Y-11557]